MLRERTVDCGTLYERERQALLDVVADLTPPQQATRVPATPAWNVRDVIAHLLGIAADLNAGDFGDGSGDEWTARQVARCQGWSFGELRAAWDAEAPRFEDGLRLLGYPIGSHFVGDLVQHAADVGQALGHPHRPGTDESVLVALDFYLDSFHGTLAEAGVAVELRAGDDRWSLGDGEPVATLSVDPFELLRVLGGRRSDGQLRALAWTGDVDRVAGLVSRYGIPGDDLPEP